MNFREFYNLYEDTKTYILMKDRTGQYRVIGPRSSQELPDAMQSAKHANNPRGMWTYNISGGQLNLPPELEGDKEPILRAHYARMGFDHPAGNAQSPQSDDSDYIDASVFNPKFGQHDSQWKPYNQQAGTVDYVGHPIASGMPTPQPRRI